VDASLYQAEHFDWNAESARFRHRQGPLLAFDVGVTSQLYKNQFKVAAAIAVNEAETRSILPISEAGGPYSSDSSGTLTKIDTGVPTPTLKDVKLDGAGQSLCAE